jgi:MEMO1 family protein
MIVRKAAVAGAFYDSSSQGCREHLRLLQPARIDPSALPETIVGGVVPHAGWVFSGAVCAAVYAAVATRRQPATFVLFGAAHHYVHGVAAMFAEGAWATPLGAAQVDADLARQILEATPLVEDDPIAHEAEHSIEVQVPFVQYLFPQARILPILVRPSAQAVAIGQAVARVVQAVGADVVYIGSSDLTHYGPNYSFVPQGVGPRGLAWARDVNDRRLIERMQRMMADQIVAEAAEHHNACGPGAVAAAVEACRQGGARRGVLLSHLTSNEVAASLNYPSGEDAVGYAGMVFG